MVFYLESIEYQLLQAYAKAYTNLEIHCEHIARPRFAAAWRPFSLQCKRSCTEILWLFGSMKLTFKFFHTIPGRSV